MAQTGEMDHRISNPSTTWQLWYSDMFDMDAPPSLEASGTNIVNGLYELWLHTLREGVLENGSASFSRFYLTWADTVAARVDVLVNPFSNRSLVLLQRWAGLTHQSLEREATAIAEGAEQEKNAILLRLSQLHYELLQNSSRWQATAIDWSVESRELLAHVETMTGPEEL